MKYTGRILGILVVLVPIVAMIYIYGLLDSLVWYLIVIFMISIFIACKLGWEYDQYEFMSKKDSLTKICNRYCVLDNFDKKLDIALKKNQKLGIFIVDCDNFKYINDKYGHLQGDIILKEIANLFMKYKNKLDIVCRWGGDEFLVLKYGEDTRMKCINDIKFIDEKLKHISKKLGIDISVSVGLHPSRIIRHKIS